MEEDATERDNSMHSEKWELWGNRCPKSEIVYFCQMFVVFVIIVTSIANLTLNNGKSELWIALLSSAIGYTLPNPKMKHSNL